MHSQRDAGVRGRDLGAAAPPSMPCKGIAAICSESFEDGGNLQPASEAAGSS